jgi:hypothetical protein
MAIPKFSVGEVVILVCTERPDLNGEHTVIAIPVHGETYMGFNCNFIMGYGYDIGIRSPAGRPIIAAENALRKKHIPGELSYHQLIKSLDQPVTRGDFA